MVACAEEGLVELVKSPEAEKCGAEWGVRSFWKKYRSQIDSVFVNH